MNSTRINIVSALKNRESSSISLENLTPEELSRKKVRDALERRRLGHPTSLEDIRKEALGDREDGLVNPAPKKRVRLASQHLQDVAGTETASRPSARREPSSVANSKPPSKNSRRKCRDAIFFKSDVEYEDYLLQEKEYHGLYLDLYDHLKVLYVSRKNLPSLLSLWDDLESMGMDSCEAHLERAETLRQMDELDKAMLYLEKAIRSNPKSVIALRSLTITNKLKKDYELALHWADRWNQVSPGEAECSYQLGTIHHRAHSYDLARSHLKRALGLDPSHLMARSLLESIGYDG